VKARLAVLGILPLLLAAPAAAAGSAPLAYFLKDGPLLAAEDGLLNTTRPNATQPSLRAVHAAGGVVPVQFVTSSNATHAPRIYGPLYLALWVGPSPIVKANLTATAYLVNATGSLALGNASMPLDANLSKLPQPTALIPPYTSPSTTDPQGWITQIVYYELMQILPTVAPPPQLLYLGFVNIAVDPESRLAVTFELTPGPGQVLPQGVFGTIQYNATINPSFLYVPWYVPDPPRPPPPTYAFTYSNPASSPRHTSTEGPASAKERGGGLPGPEAALVLVGLVAVAVAIARRR
jgi:hypothetical protein